MFKDFIKIFHIQPNNFMHIVVKLWIKRVQIVDKLGDVVLHRLIHSVINGVIQTENVSILL